MNHSVPCVSETNYINTLNEATLLIPGACVNIRTPKGLEVLSGVISHIVRTNHSPIYNHPILKGRSHDNTRKASCPPSYIEPYDVITVQTDNGIHCCVTNSDVGPHSAEYDDCLIIQDGMDVISCAAQRTLIGDKEWVIPSPAHYDETFLALASRIHSVMAPETPFHAVNRGQGFLTRRGEYVDRQVAWRIALAARQIRHHVGGCYARGGTLFSECLL